MASSMDDGEYVLCDSDGGRSSSSSGGGGGRFDKNDSNYKNCQLMHKKILWKNYIVCKCRSLLCCIQKGPSRNTISPTRLDK